MKDKYIILLFSFFLIVMIKSQVGINTSQPKATLHVAGDLFVQDIPTVSVPDYALTTGEDGIITKVKVEMPQPAKNKRSALNYGTVIPGNIGVLYKKATGGKLANTRVINNGQGNYSVGNINDIPAVAGGINWVIGNNYTISNPEPGVFDIDFGLFFSPYSFTATIFDNYSPDMTDDEPKMSMLGNRLANEYDVIIRYLGEKIRIEIVKVNSKEKANLSFFFTATGITYAPS